MESPSLWVAISFGLFIIVFARPVWKFVTIALDKRIKEIKDSIDEATKLREEAQDLLASNKRKVVAVEKEVDDIVNKAREEAENIKSKLGTELETSLKNRQKIANDRISQAESEAIESIKQMNVEIAIKATEELLQKRLDSIENLKMIDEAIEELPNKLVG
tara:strand:+ start:377 stop:859 length:483 start_codon:yes stop_codon:yes gene_type:complete